MATAAQIEANRRNSQKSCGPRTDEGKSRSRLNALDHGCRANILVLPTEHFGEFENERMAWRMSFRPRNMAEEVLIDRLVSLAWQEKRIARAQTARLTKRMWHSGIDDSVEQEEDVLELGQRLFLNACGAIVLHLHHDLSELNSEDDEPWRMSDYSDDEEHPIRLVHRLQGSLAGCEWLLNQWARLRDLLDQGVPWLPSDKLRAVRLLGRHPIDALDSTDVARVYLASHVLLNEEGPAYQDVLNELSADEVPTFERAIGSCGITRSSHPRMPRRRGQCCGRSWIVPPPRLKANSQSGVELAELEALSDASDLSWDDTPEGERLRRYELTCKRAWQRTFELLLKIRQTGAELDLSMIPSIGPPLSLAMSAEIELPEPPVTNGVIAPDEPVAQPEPPNEANSASENAPNEPNSGAQTPTSERADGLKDLRIDAPHTDHKPGGIGKGGKVTGHSALDEVLGGRKSTLMNLGPIFGEG